MKRPGIILGLGKEKRGKVCSKIFGIITFCTYVPKGHVGKIGYQIEAGKKKNYLEKKIVYLSLPTLS